MMKKNINPRSQIIELGKQLGLSTEQIHSILINTQSMNEHLSFAFGPPMYGGALYATVSINDFKILKK